MNDINSVKQCMSAKNELTTYIWVNKLHQEQTPDNFVQ